MHTDIDIKYIQEPGYVKPKAKWKELCNQLTPRLAQIISDTISELEAIGETEEKYRTMVMGEKFEFDKRQSFMVIVIVYPNRSAGPTEAGIVNCQVLVGSREYGEGQIAKCRLMAQESGRELTTEEIERIEGADKRPVEVLSPGVWLS
jgi:hypothetical protein